MTASVAMTRRSISGGPPRLGSRILPGAEWCARYGRLVLDCCVRAMERVTHDARPLRGDVLGLADVRDAVRHRHHRGGARLLTVNDAGEDLARLGIEQLHVKRHLSRGRDE